MTETVSKLLIVYGPLGVMALVAMLIAVRLYRDLQSERKEHTEEMKTMQDRYITKADTWMSKYQELYEKTIDLIDAIEKRRT